MQSSPLQPIQSPIPIFTVSSDNITSFLFSSLLKSVSEFKRALGFGNSWNSLVCGIDIMGITSLQVCMDSSDWLQATISEENAAGMDSSSSPITTPTGDDTNSLNLTCSRPLIERRLRPQHEQSLKCPRCESTHTKFCYYNNYSLSQPRYFCKTCRRYWTKGGTLRNIPVGGGCRKNKKTSSSKNKSHHPSSEHQATPSPPPPLIQPHHHHHLHASPAMVCYDGHANSTDLQLAFPEQLQFSAGMFNNGGGHGGNPNFPIDFLENKYENLILGGQDFVGNVEGFGGEFVGNPNPTFHGFSALGFSTMDHHGSSSSSAVGVLDNCQRLLQPYDHNHHHHHHHQGLDQSEIHEVKPNTAKMLSIEWHDHQQGCNSDPGYGLGGLGSWTGLMNGYGSSNPLV